MFPLKLLIMSVCLPFVIGVCAAPASAENWSRSDATGDVQVTDAGTSEIDPEAKVGDITRMRVEHGQRRVELTVRFRDIKNDAYAVMDWWIKADDRTLRVEHALASNSVMVLGLDGLPRNCDGVKSSRSFADEIARVSVPRSCLRRPDAIKVSPVFRTIHLAGEPNHHDWGLSNGLESTGRYSGWITHD